jgi:hypothetical protein
MNSVIKGKIYKVSNPDSQKYYIGSTQLDNLNKRLSQHINRYKQFINGKDKNYSVFDVIMNDKTKIELLEGGEYLNKEELLSREKHHIKINKDNVVNRYIPNRNIKEYYTDNIDKYKKYYKDNREKLLKYQNKYNKTIRDNKKFNPQVLCSSHLP